MAHIGVLRVIERAGIPVDIIAGTSMGALIGGLYSIGYDADTLDSLVMAQDWGRLLSDKVDTHGQSLAGRERQHTYIISRPISLTQRKTAAAGGLIVGTNLSKLFARLTIDWHDSISFDSLPIPFACVATDIVRNEEYDFRSGYLSEAMRASMAIPGVFTPVRKDSLVLVDGGLRNNYPADIARLMGADVVIGVSVQGNGRTAEDLQSGPDVLMQIVDVNCKNKYSDNWNSTDVPIRVNTKGYSTASFTSAAIDSLIARGEEAALQHYDKLMQLKRSLGLTDDWTPRRIHRAVPADNDRFLRIDTVTFDKIAPADGRYIISKYGLRRIDGVTMAGIGHAVSALSSDLLYTDVRYNLVKHTDGYALNISAGGRRSSQVNLGVRFDTEEMVALQANITHTFHTRMPLSIDFTGRLGKRSMARVDAELTPVHYGQIGLSYIFNHSDINIYSHGDRDYNFTYNSHTLQLRLLRLNLRNFMLDMGVHADFYDFKDVLAESNTEEGEIDNIHLYSYQFRLNYDSEDKWFFATRGARLTAGFGYYTDNFVSYKGGNGIAVADGLWRISIPMTRRLTVQPMVYGRLIFSDKMPLIMSNAIGGQLPKHYFNHQLPFAGIGHVEFIDDMMLAVQLRAQQRIMDNNYVMLRVALAQNSDTMKRLFSHGPMTGYEAAYYYNSMFGPLGVTAGYASRTQHPYIYINLGFQF